MTSSLGDPGPIAAVERGMPVVDAVGVEVGTVDVVKMGDPEAVTAEGQGARTSPHDPLQRVGEALGSVGRTLPPGLAERLLRRGYLKVDSKGLFAHDAYAEAGQVARVEDGTVHLSVGRDDLIREQ